MRVSPAEIVCTTGVGSSVGVAVGSGVYGAGVGVACAVGKAVGVTVGVIVGDTGVGLVTTWPQAVSVVIRSRMKTSDRAQESRRGMEGMGEQAIDRHE